VTIGAVHGTQVAQVYWVLERGRLCRSGQRHFGFALLQDDVTGIAVFADDLAIGAGVLTVVTAEASLVVEVSHVVGVRLPIQVHFWKRSRPEDLLQFRDGLVDVRSA
jgi:hypothetical protein